MLLEQVGIDFGDPNAAQTALANFTQFGDATDFGGEPAFGLKVSSQVLPQEMVEVQTSAVSQFGSLVETDLGSQILHISSLLTQVQHSKRTLLSCSKCRR